MFLLEKAQVATVTGNAFGNPNCRISYAASKDKITKQLKELKNVFTDIIYYSKSKSKYNQHSK